LSFAFNAATCSVENPMPLLQKRAWAEAQAV